jgi:hypothetical protein
LMLPLTRKTTVSPSRSKLVVMVAALRIKVR